MSTPKNNFSISGMFKNMKILRKIQIGFLAIAAVSAAIAINDVFQMGKFEKAKDNLFSEYVGPRNNISDLYAKFQKIQFLMMKLSMPGFADTFNQDIQQFQKYKTEYDSVLTALGESQISEASKQTIKQINDVWSNYKNVVADAIVSAAYSRDYEMASVIAATSGNEEGNKLVNEFDSVIQNLEKNAASINNGIVDNIYSAKIMIATGMFIGTVIFLIFSFFFAPTITKPIEKMKLAVKELSLGNNDVKLDIDSKDETGQLAAMLNVLKEAQVEKAKAAQAISEGKLEKVVPASDKDVLAHAFNSEVDTINHLLVEAQTIIAANQNGDLSIRGDLNKFSGSWRQILEGINSILDSIVAPISEASTVLQRLAKSDFTARMQGQYNGDYESIKNNVNKVVESLNIVLGKVHNNSENLAQAASEISASTEEMAAGANEQTSQTQEIASAIEQMTKTIFENTKSAHKASETAKHSGNKAKDGGKVIAETIEGINRIADVVNQSSETIKKLGVSSSQIGEIVQVINDIADQTNLLALNAAIEAARAGEQGRGFAVVADEVRKLAERTTKATKEIESMIKQIQVDTTGAISAIQKGTVEVEKGKELAKQAEDSLQDIITSSEQVTDITTAVAAASEEQAAASEQIAKNIDAISSVTYQSAEGTSRISQAAEGLYRMTEELKSIVNEFNLDKALAFNEEEKGSLAINGNGRLRRLS